MRITNETYQLRPDGGATWLGRMRSPLSAALGDRTHPLRLSIVDVSAHDVVVEATVVRFEADSAHADALSLIEILHPRTARPHTAGPFGVVQIIPTGTRCEFGGFAGDACPVTNLLAASADVLITHPNAVNASELNEMAGNVLYVEGRSLDDFLLGHLGLSQVRANRIGTFIDRSGIGHLDDVVNTVNAARSAGGVDCELYTVLEDDPGVEIEWSATGCAAGTIRNPAAILESVEQLLAEGVHAVGGVSVIRGVGAEEFASHLRGETPNPSGGVEAIITHLISKLFRVPTAHAPLPYYQDVKERSTSNPRASAEFISTPHYFSVLKGLARAPRLVPLTDLDHVPSPLLSVNNVGAVVMPATCLGGIPALAAELHDIPLIAVEENDTILDVTNAKMRMQNVVPVRSYLEAAGVVQALRAGIALSSVQRPIRAARPVDPTPNGAKPERPARLLQR